MAKDYRVDSGDVDEEEGVDIKVMLRDVKDLYDKVTTSDLQGIAMGYAIKLEKHGLLHSKRSEAEDIFLLCAEGELDINEAKRFLLDMFE